MEKEKLEVIEKMNARGKDNILDCWVDWWVRMQFWTEETKLNEKLSIHQVEADQLGKTSSKKFSSQEEANPQPEPPNPSPTSQQEECQGRSLPHPQGEGRMSQGEQEIKDSALRIEKRRQGADKRAQRRVTSAKKPYYATLFGFSAFWTHAEKGARKDAKIKVVEEEKCTMKKNTETYWKRYFGSSQRRGPPLATVPHSNTVQNENICELDLLDVTSEENNFEKITTHSNESQETVLKTASSDLMEGGLQEIQNFKRKLTKLNKPL